MATHTTKLPREFASGLALCAGSGGLELGLSLALGEKYKTVGYVEREPYAAAALVKHMEEASLGEAPIWDDIKTFKGRDWRGCVDIISSGFPCQPFSLAGSQKYIQDERWLWPSVKKTIRDVRPSFFFMENVSNIKSKKSEAFHEILRDLAELGFNAEWEVLGANQIGAPHVRKRLFLLAYPNSPRLKGLWTEFFRKALSVPSHKSAAFVGHSNYRVNNENKKIQPGRAPNFFPSTFPPCPNDFEGWRAALDYNPSIEPALCRSSDGTPFRVDRLKLTGNSVVPVVAATAFLALGKRAGIFE